MTTGFSVFVIVLLALVAGAGAWWLYRRWQRPGEHGALVRDLPATLPVVAATAPIIGDADGLTERDVLSRLHALAFTDCAVGGSQADNPAHSEVLHSVAASLARLQPGSRYAPRRPRLLPQLLRAVNDQDASGRGIANIIAQDPALAGNLLRVANSPLYRVRLQPLTSIESAVAMIGTDGVRHLIAVALMQPVMDGEQGVFGRLAAILWQHGLMSAAAAVVHTRQVDHDNGFAAQMAGLVHGLGAIVVVRMVRDGYAVQPGLTPVPGVFDDLLPRWSAHAALQVTRDWELSADLAAALDQQQRDAALGELDPLARSLRVGRVAAAAALLRNQGLVDDRAARDLLQQIGVRDDVAARILERLANPETNMASP